MVELFGYTKEGQEVHKITIGDPKGDHVGLLSYGAVIQSIMFAGKDMCLGYDDVAGYQNNSGCLGAAIGRCANRIADGVFEMDGVRYSLSLNKGTFHQHGGFSGFGCKVWNFKEIPDGVVFSHHSPDGDEGYPGAIDVSLAYTFKNGALDLSYDAVADKDTMINLTNHSYFNLNGKGTVLDHILQVNCDKVAWSDLKSIPDGTLVNVAGTPFDFRSEKKVGWDFDSHYPLFASKGGYDHNFLVFNNGSYRKSATLRSLDSGIEMEVWTDQDDIVIYTGNGLKGQTGKYGQKYVPFTGICFETQYMTNAVNIEGFRKPLFKAGEHFTEHTSYVFKKL